VSAEVTFQPPAFCRISVQKRPHIVYNHVDHQSPSKQAVYATYCLLAFIYRKSTNSWANLPTPMFWHKVLHQYFLSADTSN
jgi:hypothetical protein